MNGGGSTPVRPAIFLSYRRDDTEWPAQRLHDVLSERYGDARVFRDIETIPPGVRFREFIEDRIAKSDVFVLLIGKLWVSIESHPGLRRLDESNDILRLEVESALQLGMPVIPVLVGGATMPSELDLPPSLRGVREFNGSELSSRSWDYDIGRLVKAIDDLAANLDVHARVPSQPIIIAPPTSDGDREIWRPDAIAVSPDAQDVAMITGSDKCTISVWSLAERGEAMRLASDHRLGAIWFSPAGKWIAGFDRHDRNAAKSVTVWSTDSGAVIARFRHREPVRRVIFSPSEKDIFIVRSSAPDADGWTECWTLPEAKNLGILSHGFREPVRAVVFSPDHTYRVTVAGYAARLCTGTGEKIRDVDDLFFFEAASFSADNAFLSIVHNPTSGATYDSYWPEADRRIRSRRVLSRHRLMHVGFDTSATRIIAEAQVAGIGGRGLLWNTATDEQLHLWEATGPKDDLLQSAFDAAESRLITNRRSSGVQVWDCTTGRQLSHLPDATCMALGSAGDYLVTGEKDCSVTLRPIRCIEP